MGKPCCWPFLWFSISKMTYVEGDFAKKELVFKTKWKSWTFCAIIFGKHYEIYKKVVVLDEVKVNRGTKRGFIRAAKQ